LNWEANLGISRDSVYSVLSWLDNFNAITKPSTFGTRWRDDEAAAPGYALPQLADVQNVRCSCSHSGMCGSSCECVRNLLECSTKTCGCPCVMGATIYGDHGNVMTAWRREREKGIAAMDGRQEEIDSMFVFGKSGPRPAITCTNWITTCVGEVKPSRSLASAPPSQTAAVPPPLLAMQAQQTALQPAVRPCRRKSCRTA
jgi:hypothetical protein